MYTVSQADIFAISMPRGIHWTSYRYWIPFIHSSSLLIYQTMRAWCQTHETYIIQGIENKGLDDVALFPTTFNNSVAHPRGAVLTVFAVHIGVQRVRTVYKCNKFLLISDEDPIIRIQVANNRELKRACEISRRIYRMLPDSGAAWERCPLGNSEGFSWSLGLKGLWVFWKVRLLHL